MRMVCFPGLLRTFAGFQLNLIWPAGLFRPAGRVYSWGSLTVTLLHRVLHIVLTAISLQLHFNTKNKPRDSIVPGHTLHQNGDEFQTFTRVCSFSSVETIKCH